MHLAIIKINLHVHDAIAGDDAFPAGGVYAFLDRRNVDAVDVLTAERLGELQARVARGRLDAHPDFGELPGTPGLLFVSVLRFAATLDRFTIGHARLDEIEIHLVTPLEPLGHDLQMQVPLAGKDRLVQL